MEMKPQPTILLNGTPHPVAGEIALGELLGSIGLAGKPVVVELNEQAVYPRDHAATRVRPGDRIEIVALAAGG